MSSLNGVPEDPSYALKHIDEIGGPNAYNHFPVGWAWAMNTPFQWGKQVASHFGGTRNPLVVSWPARIKDTGGIRTQFHHVIDIVPTILEAAGIPEPSRVNGVKQKPIEGVSMIYTFDDAKAKEHADDAVLRDVRQPRALSRRLDRSLPARPAALGERRARSISLRTSGSSTTSTSDFSEANDLASARTQRS